MTRVLILEASGNLWGSERALLDLVQAMPTVEVAVCCPSGKPLTGELSKLGIPVFPYYVDNLHTKSKLDRLGAALGVVRACLAFRPDVIYLNQAGAYRVALAAACLLNVPLIGHIRIFEDAAYIARHRPRVHRLRGLIAISGAIEREIQRFPQLQDIPTHRVLDGYKPRSRFPTHPRIRNRIACVGRLAPVKGQDVLVRALGVLQQSSIDIECVIAGDGDAMFVDKIRRLAADQQVESVIHWTGFIPDVIALLQTCSVLVCPSHREPLGRVIFEAWDAGAIPIVFAGSAGAAELVTAAVGGILYDSQDPDCLAAAIRTAMELPPVDAAEMVEKGRRWMGSHCNATAYGAAVAEIIEAAAA